MQPRLTDYPVALITITVAILTLWLSVHNVDAASASSNWERHQLFQPSPKLLQMEHRGRVTVYDGLNENDVDQAMDEQFERIDKMMFVRVKTDADHGLDDGCD